VLCLGACLVLLQIPPAHPIECLDELSPDLAGAVELSAQDIQDPGLHARCLEKIHQIRDLARLKGDDLAGFDLNDQPAIGPEQQLKVRMLA
jgi:hypothetical protein